MRITSLSIALSVGTLFLATVLFFDALPIHAASFGVDVKNDTFSDTIMSISVGDSITWTNKDPAIRKVEVFYATDSGYTSPIVSKDLAASTATSGKTLSKTFSKAAGLIGNFVYLLDHQSTISGTISVATAAPTATAVVTDSPTPTVTPVSTPTPVVTAIPTNTPVVSATPSPVATSTPTATPVATDTSTPSPLVTATPTPTLALTVTPTPVITASPVPTATPTVIPALTPTPTPVITFSPVPTATPLVTPTATPVLTPTPVATVIPTSTPVPSPTVAPTPTPEGEVLPAFAPLRRMTCSAQLLSSNSVVQTDRLSPLYLIRGNWSVQSLSTINAIVTAQLHLNSVRTVNLLFGSNAFFNSDRTVAANENTTVNGTSVQNVLDKAAQSWCAR